VSRTSSEEIQSSAIVGSWTDACPCPIVCPCWKSHKSSARSCINFHVFHIESGRFHGVDLQASTFVLVNSPLVLGDAPAPDTLITQTADPEKVRILQEGVLLWFGFAPPKTLRATIAYRETASEQEITIRNLLSYKIRFNQRQPISFDVSDYLYPWLFDARQGIAKSVVYSPAGQSAVRYSHTNALRGRFRIPVKGR